MAYCLAKLSESQTWRNQDEHRYEPTQTDAARVIKTLTSNLPVVTYGDAPPTTLVATLYFDTEEHYYFQRAKSNGKLSSIKVRAREYLPLSDDSERRVLGQSAHCYLERKERTGTVRDKYRIRVEKDQLASLLQHQDDLPEGADLLQDELESRTLTPVMISMYERRVWGTGGSEGLRITFDERIRYYRPPAGVYEDVTAMTPSALGPPGAKGPERILEVKHAAGEEQPAWLVTLLSELPEATGFSKFIDGMNKLCS